MELEKLELDVWEGDWGLPSVDHRCLSVLAYCKFSDCPVNVRKSNNPWKSPSGDLPVLRHENGTETRIQEIFNVLRQKNWGTDHDLTSKQSADIVAFVAMLEEKLLPSLHYTWWVEARNYIEFSRPWFGRVLRFPFNFYIPLRKHKEAVNMVYHCCGGDNLEPAEREAKVNKSAKECLNLLSSRLGDANYFFGKTPSSLDAIVFGYLAPLLKAPFPNPTLQNHLKGCANLCRFCQRILDYYFPLTPQELTAMRKKEDEERKRQAESTEFPNKKRNMMVAGMVALTAMVGYAFLSGLVSVQLVDDDAEEANDQPDDMGFDSKDGDQDGSQKED